MSFCLYGLLQLLLRKLTYGGAVSFQVCYGLLLQYFATLTNQKPLNFHLLNLLVKPLMEMSAEIPYFSAICARERILRTRTKFSEDIKDPGFPSVT